MRAFKVGVMYLSQESNDFMGLKAICYIFEGCALKLSHPSVCSVFQESATYPYYDTTSGGEGKHFLPFQGGGKEGDGDLSCALCAMRFFD